ncbi:MAG: DUF2071 domain-containing protein [Actinobacteria bacterium]|nr:DUF2071 domain-containing protein [Actinomycetota bacterium]
MTGTRVRSSLWWLAAGTVGMCLALLVGAAAAPDATDLRWSGVGLVAALGGIATATVGPALLPLARRTASGAVARGRRLRPVTSGAVTGLIATIIAFMGVSLFPDVLAPIHVNVGRGIPELLLDELVWVLPSAAVAGGVLGLVGWASVRHPDAATAFGRLVRYAGWPAHIAWLAALVTVVAATVGGLTLAAGAPGGGSVAERGAAIVDAGASWTVGWALWGLASLGLLAVLVLLIERAGPAWRTLAVTVAAVAIAADLLATALFAAALPAAAPITAPASEMLFVSLERLALALSGPVANTLYGVLGVALVGAAGRALHPLLRVIGRIAFGLVLVNAVLLPLAPSAVAPTVALSVLAFTLFALGLGWQLAVSRRLQPALEASVRQAARALVPVHPAPMTARATDVAAIDLALDPSALAPLLPPGTRPQLVDGRAHVVVIGARIGAARFAFVPRALGLPTTPIVSLRVPILDRDGEPAVAFLRGWSESTLTAACVHWTTGFELSRVELELASTADRWSVRGAAGSVEVDLVADADAVPPTADLGTGRAILDRAGQLAQVRFEDDATVVTPARLLHARIPFLQRLGAEVVGAAFLAPTDYRAGRARWR